MIKKYAKITIVILTFVAMMTGVSGCGSAENSTDSTSSEAASDEGTNTDSSVATEENTDKKEVYDTASSSDVATAGDAYYPEKDSDGNYIMMGIRFSVPEAYVYTSDGSTEANLTFVDETDGAAVIVAVESDTSVYNGVDIIGAFDMQVKTYYGDSATYSTVTYNGHEGTEWVLDNDEIGFVGRSLVIIDETAIVYIEYLNYSGNISAYQEIANSIEFE